MTDMNDFVGHTTSILSWDISEAETLTQADGSDITFDITKPFEILTEQCIDMDQGVTDEDDDGCEYYDDNPERCGDFDDDDFTASELCCACKIFSWGI